MSVNMTLKMRLGPFVTLEIEGSSCEEISKALEGHQRLNQQLDEMCSDLAQRVYPEEMPDDPRPPPGKGQGPRSDREQEESAS